MNDTLQNLWLMLHTIIIYHCKIILIIAHSSFFKSFGERRYFLLMKRLVVATNTYLSRIFNKIFYTLKHPLLLYFKVFFLIVQCTEC